jgi:putative aldouronate transport system permease protein
VVLALARGLCYTEGMSVPLSAVKAAGAGTQALSGGRRRGALAREIVRHRHYYVLLLPAIACFVVVNYVPMGGIVMAFKRYTIQGGIWRSPWVGFRYFKEMAEAPGFLQILWNTLRISLLRIAFGFPAPIVFALLLNEMLAVAPKRIFQTVSYLPHFLSWVVVASLALYLLSLRGPINYLLALFGLKKVIFLQEPGAFVPILIVTGVWKEVGWGSIIYLAAISGIDPQLYEAAEIDGAGRIQRMRHVTFPSLSAVIVTLFILRIGHMMDAGFDQIFNMYNPLVYGVADIIDTFVYRAGLQSMRYSFATAVGLSKNLVGFALLLVTNQIVRRLGGQTLT